MKNGFIYTIVNKAIELVKYLNLVEFFKLIAKKISPNDKVRSSRIAVDIYIIIKWSIIVIFWRYMMDENWTTIIVVYLILSNLFTYFYYHVWSDTLAKGGFGVDRIKRRFLNLMQAIAYNIIGFAYLFAVPFSENFNWTNDIERFNNSILLSLANSMTADYESVNPVTEFGNNLLLIETVTSFIFLTIILSNSIPEINEEQNGL